MTTTNSALWDAASDENRPGGEERAKGEEKSNRDNPIFKNRRNPFTPKEKTFSNRDKNSTSGLPYFRPWERHSASRQSGDWRSREDQNGLDPGEPLDDDFGARQRQRARS
jgi:hypothetical protein